MNPQSVGTVTLHSSDPSAAPIIDPKFFSHPFDRRVAIEAMRQMMAVMKTPALAKTTIKMIGSPESISDKDIWVSSPSSF